MSSRPVDDLGAFATVSDHPPRERSLYAALRATTIATIVLTFTNAASIWLIVALFPLQKVQPYLVTFSDKREQIVNIEPAQIDGKAYAVMTEVEVRDYVAGRHTIPSTKSAIDAAWGPRSRLALRMVPDAYKQFVEANKSDLAALRSQGYVRAVEIAAVSRVARDTWQAEFQTVDTPAVASLGAPGDLMSGPPMTEVRQTWVATLRVGYEPNRVRYDERLLNPLGFTVHEYSVTKKAGL